MKKKLTSNIGLKILSVLLAAILWLVITNVDDPVKSRPFPNVLVNIQNEEVISTPNQIYEIIEGRTVSFRVLGKRSTVDNLTSNDFNVTADFSKLLTGGNTVMIDVTCKKADVTIDNLKPKTLTIRLDEILEEDFKVNVVTEGEAMEGYYVGEKSASPVIVRISGPKGRIEMIKDIVAVVDVTGASQSTVKLAVLKALDDQGKEIDSSKLTFSNVNNGYIQVNLKLYKTKEVDLVAKTIGTPAEGYTMTGYDYEPKTVVIASEDESALDKINYLQISEDIEGESGDVERDVNLQEALDLPKGVILVGDNLTVGMNIKIERLETKEITIWPNDIELRNRKADQEVGFLTTGPIKVQVKGPAEEIEEIDRPNLKPYIDLADCTIGTYGLTVEAKLPEHTTIFETPMVSISIK